MFITESEKVKLIELSFERGFKTASDFIDKKPGADEMANQCQAEIDKLKKELLNG